ncbi:MAG: DUF2059 domain-containing protein [Beijerinckiaceae bacterium]
MTIFRSLLLATALIFSHSLAIAQQPAPAAPAPAAAPITESHLAVAREVVAGSGLGRTFQGMVPQIADQIRASYTRTRPEIVKDMEESLKAMIEDLSKQTDQITNSAARLYANRLSEAELKEAAAFFKSAAGQKYVNFQAQILNDLFAEMQVFSQTLGNVMVDRLREDLKKKGHTI